MNWRSCGGCLRSVRHAITRRKRRNKSTTKTLKSSEKVQNNGKDKYPPCENELFSRRNVTEARVSHGI